jgi:hypothetical protein
MSYLFCIFSHLTRIAFAIVLLLVIGCKTDKEKISYPAPIELNQSLTEIKRIFGENKLGTTDNPYNDGKEYYIIRDTIQDAGATSRLLLTFEKDRLVEFKSSFLSNNRQRLSEWFNSYYSPLIKRSVLIKRDSCFDIHQLENRSSVVYLCSIKSDSCFASQFYYRITRKIN